ncbi:response regulator [Stenotrophomonas sp.]|jgi:DNA-binding response OmpR family regulator|uniref:response regulator n=1 Tax=Stenotrophomonas sp. TaxID=69392 RepID=UPI0029B4FFCC|nr:response regulator [Stenotrophomonas sp.]MDX3933855.1 response regulator [Stenotrophomonas sp.]
MNDGILSGCRVYVVEDNYLLAMSVSEFLESAGAQVLGITGKLAEAQRYVTEHDGDIDAVVLDVNLRSETSYPLADQLVASKIPFLFTTGYDAASIDARFRDHPVCCKPFVPSALWEMVSAICTRH